MRRGIHWEVFVRADLKATSSVPRRHDQSGAVMVELAFALTLLLTLTFGLIEFGLAMRNALTVASATRSGVRTASSEPRQSTYATDAASAVATALSSLPANAPEELWVYKANASGMPDSGNFTSCTACYKYTWNSSTRSWTAVSGNSWASSSQVACGGANSDAVGVYVRITHRYVTKLFGSTKTLTDRTVMRLEPVPGVCR
jgi:Flp pilus assembly protein TadG